MPGQMDVNRAVPEGTAAAWPGAAADPALKLKRTLRILLERRLLILNIVLILTAAILLGVLQLKPSYTAKMAILVEPRPRSREEIAVVLSGEAVNVAVLESQARVISSRTLAARVIDDLNLMNDPEFNETLRSDHSEASEGGGSLAHWVAAIVPPEWLAPLGLHNNEVLSPEAEAARIREQVISAYLRNLSVTRDRVAQVIEIAFSSHNAQRAAAIANRVGELYIVDQYEARYEAIRQSTEWLGTRLSGLAEQVRQAEEAVEVFRRNNSLLLEQAGMEVTSRQIAELNGQLVTAMSNREELNTRVQRIRELAASGRAADSVAEVMSSPVIVGLRQRQSDMVREEAELVARYGPRHPRIVQIQAQRRELLNNIQAEVGRIISNLQNEAAVAAARVDSVQNSIAELTHRAEDINRAGIRLRELEREAEARRELYGSFRERFNITDQQENQPPEARIISRAAVPTSPSFPRIDRAAIAGTTFSVMVGVAIAFLLEILQSGFLTAQKVEEELRVTNLAMLPRVSRSVLKRYGPEDYVLDKPLSVFSEALGGLRTALFLLNVDNPVKVVLITSAIAGEGKSVLALSLGRLAAQAGQRVIVLDGDLRRPNVHRLIGGNLSGQSLAKVLSGQTTLDEAIQTDSKSPLHYIASAGGAPNPADLFASRQMRGLLETLRRSYDLIVIDSAPIMAVADSRVLATLADCVVLAVRWSKTPRKAAASALRLLIEGGGNVAGTVLTMVNMRRHSRYGYEESGYYGRGYYKYHSK